MLKTKSLLKYLVQRAITLMSVFITHTFRQDPQSHPQTSNPQPWTLHPKQEGWACTEWSWVIGSFAVTSKCCTYNFRQWLAPTLSANIRIYGVLHVHWQTNASHRVAPESTCFCIRRFRERVKSARHWRKSATKRFEYKNYQIDELLRDNLTSGPERKLLIVFPAINIRKPSLFHVLDY